MANMSYCRFQNTRSDLNDCLEALSRDKFMSEDEAKAGRWMFEEFLNFCRENGIIDGYDGDEIRTLFDNLTRKEEDDDE